MAELTDIEILQQLADRLLADLGNRIPRATGKTADARRAEVDENGLRIIVPLQVKALIDGRGPTRNSSPGNPTLRQQILVWIEAKGITPRDGITRESLAFLIARKIHREGFAGRPQILEGWFGDDDLKTLMEQLGRNRAGSILSDLKNLLTQAA